MIAVVLNGNSTEVTGENMDQAVNSKIFQDWASTLNPRFIVKSIAFQSVDLVGPPDSPRVLFIKFKADVVDEKGKFIPGIVFMRGGAVGVLMILTCEGQEYTVLTQQPRFPIGNFSFPEIPAGMLDGDGNFSGVAAKELEEELEITINQEDLFDLTGQVYGDRYPGVYPSAGGCDEFLRLFLYRKTISKPELLKLQGKCTGNASEGEQITLKVIPMADLIKETPDAKALSAYAMYDYLGI